MIGGHDSVFWVRDDTPVADILLRVVRRHWPRFAFQDADDPQTRPRSDRELPTPKGRKFFVYRDEASARGWLEEGATDDNRDSLVYAIQGHRRHPETDFRSVTLVTGDPTGEVGTILEQVGNGFRDFAAAFRRFRDGEAA